MTQILNDPDTIGLIVLLIAISFVFWHGRKHA